MNQSLSTHFLQPRTSRLVSLISPDSVAAVKIQSSYRAHSCSRLYKQIASARSKAETLRRKIQNQETVNDIRRHDKEKLKINEELMRLLLKLDSVPGINTPIREARRRVSHNIVELLEILDAVSGAKIEQVDGGSWTWDKVIAEMEENMCKESGGVELDEFCARYLGFRCLQRFLREP